MNIKSVVQNASMIGGVMLMMATGANAALVINYTTNVPGTQYVAVGGGAAGVNSDQLFSIGGQSATLTFTPNTTSGAGVPSNIDLGDFLLVCSTCSTVQSTTFGSFTFDLMVTDTTDNASGTFIGTSSGGTVSSNSSTVQINWTGPPGLTVGPGTNNATNGNFGVTHFDLVSPTSLIVAPNSGTPPGDTTIQGQVGSTPEPASYALMGAALLGLGMLRRKKLAR